MLPNAQAPRRPGWPCGGRSDLFALLASVDDGRPGEPRLLLLADVDGFRGFNARHGYPAGDAILRTVESRLAEVSGAFRVGANAFAVLLEGSPIDLTHRLAEVLAALAVEQPEPLQWSFGHVLLGGGSSGFAVCEERLEDQKRRGLVPGDSVAEVLLALMDAHDESLRTHAVDVARLAESVAGRLGLGVADRALVRRTAELHDFGKLIVAPEVLAKPGPLDEHEWEQVRRHTKRGEELLLLFPALEAVAALVRATHERYDGAGYPDGLRGDEIPLAARIVAACDAYHAMRSDRPYAAGRSSEEARAELEAAAGGQFDPAVVSAIVAELAQRRAVDAPAATHTDESLHDLARLHALLESASIVEHPDELPRALEAVAQVVGENLDYGGVVINLYRHEWDDFVVSTVYGDDPALRKLLGSTYDWSMWDQLLQSTFFHAGAYTVYAGEYDWHEQSGHRIVPDVGTNGHPDAWQSEDEIFVPFHHTDGHMLGIFNVALPRSGRRPSDEELRLLAMVVRRAARAVQRAQEMAAAAAHRRALESLLRVSSKLTQTSSGTAVLEAITAGISEALGFERVVVYLHDAGTGALEPAAAAGFELDDARLRLPFGLTELRRLFDRRYEAEGCFLVPLEEARAQIATIDGVYASARNGRGPWAWQRHWLVVPLQNRDGEYLGVVLADDPADRLLPTTERLQALRLFANQATFALEAVAQYEVQRHLAEHDALTKLRNRHSFMEDLKATLHEARARHEQLALVYCDLDGFKELNDAFGHAVGDVALARFGRVLATSIRAEDTAYRVGGDEFALLLRCCNEEEARRAVERALVTWGQQPLHRAPLEASFGIAIADPDDEACVEELLRRADEAMYDAKRSNSRLKVAA